MTRALLTTLLSVMLAGQASAAPTDDRWQYHGIHLGAHMTQDQIMAALGVTKYAKNPDIDAWNNKLGCADEAKAKTKVCKDAAFYKYGLKASEVLEEQIGGFCDDTKANDGTPIAGSFHCLNPNMIGTTPNWITVGHGITQVHVFVRYGVVASIDLMFDSMVADEFFDVAMRQLGPDGWKTEKEPIYIQHWDALRTGESFERVTKTKKTQLYGAMMTNYDEIISHPNPPAYRGVCELKLLDQSL